MSKPMTRIAFSLLIALALVLAIYTSVLGASQNAKVNAQAHIDAGVRLGLKHVSVQTQPSDEEFWSDCRHDSIINPEDY